MGERPHQSVTLMLRAAARGDEHATAHLLPLVYDELRKLAASWMARLPAGQTLQPTALVHEAYLRLVGEADRGDWESRRHFLFAISRAMRQILVEDARRKLSLKRGGGRRRVEADESQAAIEPPVTDMIAMDEALDRLERDDPRKHQIVMLRFFAGLTMEETADVLEISLRTVERDWRFIRARLHRELEVAV